MQHIRLKFCSWLKHTSRNQSRPDKCFDRVSPSQNIEAKYDIDSPYELDATGTVACPELKECDYQQMGQEIWKVLMTILALERASYCDKDSMLDECIQELEKLWDYEEAFEVTASRYPINLSYLFQSHPHDDPKSQLIRLLGAVKVNEPKIKLTSIILELEALFCTLQDDQNTLVNKSETDSSDSKSEYEGANPQGSLSATNENREIIVGAIYSDLDAAPGDEKYTKYLYERKHSVVPVYVENSDCPILPTNKYSISVTYEGHTATAVARSKKIARHLASKLLCSKLGLSTQ